MLFSSSLIFSNEYYFHSEQYIQFMHLLSSPNTYFVLESDVQACVIVEPPAQGKILYFQAVMQKHNNYENLCFYKYI